MRVSTFRCFPSAPATAILGHHQVSLGGPDAEESMVIQGTSDERLAVLAKWAEVEGYELTQVGSPRESVSAMPAGNYDGPSGSWTGD